MLMENGDDIDLKKGIVKIERVDLEIDEKEYNTLKNDIESYLAAKFESDSEVTYNAEFFNDKRMLIFTIELESSDKLENIDLTQFNNRLAEFEEYYHTLRREYKKI